jgi:hypothetical protein
MPGTALRFAALMASVAMLLAVLSKATAQQPFAIPDTTHAVCVVFDYDAGKKYVGAAVDDRFTLSEKSLWRGGSATCDVSGSWILTWPHQDAPKSGCLLRSDFGGGYDWFGVATGAAYSAASSIKCRTDGRWELVKGWH